MAITRCPYCHAIIDEADKYCNNCGTQLLFNEDEEIEEEIPGEKILDAEVEEKDYTVDEPEDEKRPAPAKDLDSEIGEELEKDLAGQSGAPTVDELLAEEAEEDEESPEDGVTEEVILVDEIEDAEAADIRGSGPPDEEGTAELRKAAPADRSPEAEGSEEDDEGEDALADEFDIEEEPEEEAAEETAAGVAEEVPPARRARAEDETKEYEAAAASPATTPGKTPTTSPLGESDAEIEYVSEAEPPNMAATAGEAGLRPVTFDTAELDDLGGVIDLSQGKVDKFLEIMAEKKAATPPTPPETPPAGPAPATPEPPTGNLPPWASMMKGAPVFPEDTKPAETRKLRGGEPVAPDTEEEVEIFPKRRAPDSTIGLPEKVSQVPLPFETTPAEEEEGLEEEEGQEERKEEEGQAEREEEGTRKVKTRYLTPEEAVLPAGRVHTGRKGFFPSRAAEPAAPSPRAAEAAEEAPEPGPSSPFRIAVFLKSKAFDVLFVGLFWLIALWLAASSMRMTLFNLLGSMSGSMIMLYAVFVFLYFFLFKFFLGETLGDRLFRPRE